jgi:hypothetical protein
MTFRTLVCFAAAAGVAVLACAARPAADKPAGEKLEWAVLPILSGGGPSHAMEQVIRSRDEWCQFWKIRKEGYTPSPPCEEPEGVDWKNHCLAVIALGQRPNGCIGIRIAGVRRQDGGVLVSAQETRRTPGPCTMAIVYPLAVVRLPAWAETVKVEYEKVEISMNAR